MTIEFAQFLGYILTGKDLISIIKELLDDDNKWLVDLADIHRKSALQAIDAANDGRYMQHMYTSIGHLRDVYNLLDTAANTRPSLWERIDEFYAGSLRLRRQGGIAEEASKIAILIAENHLLLGEQGNGQDWAGKALQSFNQSITCLRSQPTFELRGGGNSPLYAKEIKGLREEREAIVKEKQTFMKQVLSKYSLGVEPF